MKRIYLLFIVLSIFILAGCNTGASIIQNSETVDGSGQENTAEQNPQSTDNNGASRLSIQEKRTLVIGTWQDLSYMTAVYGERYHFFEDGTYIFEYANGGAKKDISESGTWRIAGDTVTLIASKKIVIEGGEVEDSLLSNGYTQESLVNGTIRIVDIVSPEEKEYIVDNFFQASEENKKRMVAIKGTRFWKVQESPYAYLNKGQFKDGEVYRSTSDEKTPLIGTWHAWYMIPSQYDERYHFYDDGTYLHEYSNYDREKRVLSEQGIWQIKNDVLSLAANNKMTIEGGEQSVEPLLPGDTNKYTIVNGIIKNIEINPPETVEYEIQLFPPKDDYSEETYDWSKEEEYSYGYWVMIVNGIRFWKLIDDPDAYQNDFFQDGDVYQPW